MDKQQLYEMSVNSIQDYTDHDITATVMKEYAIKGMYKIHSCLNEIGLLGDNSKLVALPDFTFSRSDYRFKAGFPYGSLIFIDSKSTPFIPIDFRPNCCGIIFVGLHDFEYDIEHLTDKIAKIETQGLNITGDDLRRGNHFIGIYRNDSRQKYYAIIHNSFEFVKVGYEEIPGLYIDKTNYWDGRIQKIAVADDEFSYLAEQAATDYYAAYLEHEKHSKALRVELADYLFEGNSVVFNETHEGFFSIDTIMLGSYAQKKPFVCPIMLSSNDSLPLFDIKKPIPSLSNAVFACPHGGGYSILHLNSGSYNASKNLYTVQFRNGAEMTTSDLRKLNYDYRSNTAKIWADTYKFGEVIELLATVRNFKI
jgi:hypothetical protein